MARRVPGHRSSFLCACIFLCRSADSVARTHGTACMVAWALVARSLERSQKQRPPRRPYPDPCSLSVRMRSGLQNRPRGGIVLLCSGVTDAARTLLAAWQRCSLVTASSVRAQESTSRSALRGVEALSMNAALQLSHCALSLLRRPGAEDDAKGGPCSPFCLRSQRADDQVRPLCRCPGLAERSRSEYPLAATAASRSTQRPSLHAVRTLFSETFARVVETTVQ
jgi:hypothetical protein